MPRGVKGSGKAGKGTTEPAKRRRGRKGQDAALPPVPPAEQDAAVEARPPEPPAEQPTAETLVPKSSAPEAATPEIRPPAAHDPALAAAEDALAAKYPNQQFKPGSLLPSGATAEFGSKRSVVVFCQDCGAERRVATSDVFHTSRCVSCAKKAKSAVRKRTKGA